MRLRIDLDALAPEFRAALVKREANENALAIGWPLAFGRRSGVPAIWPVGLIAAEWRRVSGFLEIDVSADDVLVNPDWLRGAARSSGWSEKDLEEVFAEADGVGLECEEFLSRLRDAAATQVRGKLSGAWLCPEIDLRSQGIFDAAALFLPEDSSFTAGAVRDLDSIAEWPEAQLARTALAPILGLTSTHQPAVVAALNVGALNAEQISAVRAACSAPLTVVTGPPGTGKSQAIVSMAASVLMAGGSVLVASKNHQALDAVQDRLGGLAPEAPFVVRTLDPSGEVDRSFSTVLRDLVQGDTGPRVLSTICCATGLTSLRGVGLWRLILSRGAARSNVRSPICSSASKLAESFSNPKARRLCQITRCVRVLPRGRWPCCALFVGASADGKTAGPALGACRTRGRSREAAHRARRPCRSARRHRTDIRNCGYCLQGACGGVDGAHHRFRRVP
ncbi:AAA domain-containing protein [Gemmobacter lanyuensis]